jgi:paraquat-inducible protein A
MGAIEEHSLRSTRNVIAAALNLLSFVVLVPGLVLPVITISASFKILIVEAELFHQTRSILGTIQHLWSVKNHFVALLILLFSVIVPVCKAILLGSLLFFKDQQRKLRAYWFLTAIGKWSMADVFATGVFICYLTSAASNSVHSHLEIGFYYFSAYCLISLTAMQLMDLPDAMLPGSVQSRLFSKRDADRATAHFMRDHALREDEAEIGPGGAFGDDDNQVGTGIFNSLRNSPPVPVGAVQAMNVV